MKGFSFEPGFDNIFCCSRCKGRFFRKIREIQTGLEVSPAAAAYPFGFSAVVKKAMKYYVWIIALFLCAASMSAQTPVGAQTSSTTVSTKPAGDGSDRYRIGYQDTLDIQIFNHPNLSRRSQVNPDGTINLFRLHDPIVAVCKTELELASEIAKAYEKDYLRDPEVSVVAVERKSQVVTVIGAVKKPGSFYIDKRTQLLPLLGFAEGPDTEHAGTRLIVFRPGSTSNCKMGPSFDSAVDKTELFAFSLKDVEEGKAMFWMEPGDVVSVQTSDKVYVYGNVNNQGIVDMKEPLTLTQALAAAGGIKSATQMDNIRVVRQKPGTTDHVETIYNFKEIAKGKAPDPFLQPNDIVAVSQNKTQSILNDIGKSLTNGIPSIFYRVP
jgi:polysaccharide export outer membrane protein